MDLQQAIDQNARGIKHTLWATGHIHRPFDEPQDLTDYVPAAPVEGLQAEYPAALDKLSLAEPAMRNAIESYQHFMTPNLEPLMARHHSERRSLAPKIDGKIGPAMLEMFEQKRCACPDYLTEDAATDRAQGNGQWRGCHSIGDFHAAIVKVMNAIPEHLMRPYQNGTAWDEVKRRMIRCNAEVGLRIWFSDDDDCPDGGHQTELSFFPGGQSYIGLALIGQGQQCNSSPIWKRCDGVWLRNSPVDERYLTLQANLHVHEDGHNQGLPHSSGGIMNPGILAVQTKWVGDPWESRQKQRYGGVPVPLEPDDPDDPPPPPTGSVFTFAKGRLVVTDKNVLLIADR